MNKPTAISSVLASMIMAVVVAGPALGGSPSVDPNSLTPAPPPGSVCAAVGQDTVICHTFKNFVLEAEPVLDLSCGTVLETSTDHRDGIRWYVHGLAERRHVDADYRGLWSMTADGSEPRADLFGAWASTSRWVVPGDDTTVLERFQGATARLSAPGIGVIVRWTGQDEPDGTHHGSILGFGDDFLSADAMAQLEKLFCDA